MSVWQITSNQLSFELQIPEKSLDLFRDYLFHRFRELYS
ncbi:hypothetical protein LCGC14_2775010, partial [marine sediment metagenome]